MSLFLLPSESSVEFAAIRELLDECVPVFEFEIREIKAGRHPTREYESKSSAVDPIFGIPAIHSFRCSTPAILARRWADDNPSRAKVLFMASRTFLTVCSVLVIGTVLAVVVPAQEYLPDLAVDHPAIQYFDRPTDDAVARLAKKMEAGETVLELRNDGLGYLPSLLEQLGVNTDSQALVFSKTSFQAPKIAPDNPRAIYFSDDVAVAFVRGSDAIEIAAFDRELGPVFYTADIQKLEREGFKRREVCLGCHLGPATSGVPGIFVGSVFPGPTGNPSPVDAIITDHRTAFEERWGGWYVNATNGQQEDRSNAVASNPAQPLVLDEFGRRNLTHLFGKVDTDGYLEPVSDIVALMTFEHQTQMVNYITRVGWEERMALHDGEISALKRAQIDADIEALVTYMLFADEVPLPEPIEGVSTFTETFPERGPRDRQGRSLRDFDLETRLFRYPLSFMVYSRSFDALPGAAKETIYRRLLEVLTGEDKDKKFSNLTDNDRRSVLEILRDTKPDLPTYFRKSAADY